MKPVAPELLSLLATRQFFAADLYTITLVTGETLRYCGGDADITCNGFLFSAGGMIGPYWDRSDNKAKCHWKVGVDVDSLIIDMLPGSATVLGVPILQAILSGVFDDAEFTLDRVYMPTWGDTRRGFIRLFVGRVAEVDVSRSIATFTITSHLELLNIQMPRNLYQAGCVNTLGDQACGVDISQYMSTGIVAAGSTVAGVMATIAGQFQQGYFDLGTLTFTSGQYQGQTFTVKQVSYGAPSVINLLGFLPAPPAAGDSFNIYAGCDKSCDLPLTVNGIMTEGQNNLDLVNGSAGSTALIGYTITGYGIPAGGYTVTGYESGAPGTPPVPTNGALLLSGTFQTSSVGQSHIYTLTKPGLVLNGCSKFNNLARFRGFPFVPAPSTAA